jgi:O-antigen ligase
MKTMLSPTQDYNWTDEEGRKEIWTRGIGYMLQYPVAGVGINNFERAECMISPKARNHIAGTGIRCTPPHNSYVQMGAELGLPGLVLWLVLVFGGIRKMNQLARRVPRHWEYGDREARFLFHAPRHLAICMTGFGVTSFFLSHAYVDPVYLLTALMAGAYTATVDRMRREQAGAFRGASPVPRMAPVRGRGGLNRIV